MPLGFAQRPNMEGGKSDRAAVRSDLPGNDLIYEQLKEHRTIEISAWALPVIGEQR